MSNQNIWGSLGDLIFQLKTSPVYGSYSKNSSGSFSEYQRILVKDPKTGIVAGQKPLKEPAGLELTTISFDFFVTSIMLYRLDQNLLERIARAGGLGAIAGSVIGSIEKDERFYVDVQLFLDKLTALQKNQAPQQLFIGEIYEGLFSVDSVKEDNSHNRDGSIKTSSISLDLTEWVR